MRARTASYQTTERAGDIVVYGGYNYESIDFEGVQYVGLRGDMWRFFVANASWGEVEVLGTERPSPRMLHAASVVENKMFVHGGAHFVRYNGDRSTLYRACGHDDLWSFDFNTSMWTMLSQDRSVCSIAPRVFLGASGVLAAIVTALLM